DALGFKIAEEHEHWLEFDTGSARLTVHAWRDADGLPLAPDQRVSFALMDDDLDAWADELRGRGVRFATSPTEEEIGRMAEVEDADGWFVVLRGPSPEVPIEEALAEDYADEEGTRIEQIRKTAEVEPGARPGFGSRKLARKKIERVATKGFDALQRTRDAERGGFTPSSGGAARPFTPRPEGSRPFTPRPEGSRPFTPRPEGSRPFTPRPEGARPFTPRPEGARPFTPRPEGSRPFTPRPDRPPRPDGPRPYSPDRPPRPDGPRPYPPPAGPQPRSDRPGGTGPRPYTPRPEGPRPGGPPRRDG